MKNCIFVLLLIFFGCNKKDCIDKTRIKESIEISKVIFEFVREKDTIHLDVPFSSELQRLNITNLQSSEEDSNQKIITTKNARRELLVEKLLSAKIKGKLFFIKSDSLEFMNQNCASNFCFPDSVLNNEKFIKSNNLNSHNSEIYKLTYPVFSSNNKKAYVEINIYTKEYSFGNSLYLEKVGTKWKIIDYQGLWDS